MVITTSFKTFTKIIIKTMTPFNDENQQFTLKISHKEAVKDHNITNDLKDVMTIQKIESKRRLVRFYCKRHGEIIIELYYVEKVI